MHIVSTPTCFNATASPFPEDDADALKRVGVFTMHKIFFIYIYIYTYTCMLCICWSVLYTVQYARYIRTSKSDIFMLTSSFTV
jgi:glycogen synthase